jgi:uroporphyrinogen decarboxylase
VDRFAQIRRLKKELGDKALVFDFNGNGVFWMPTGNEMMNFVVKLFEQPKEMHTEARQKLDAAKELARRQRDAGVDFLVQNSDFGFNSGPFISPEHFAEFVTPYMTEFVGFVHDLGLPVILHSDGNINKILDQLYSTGVDGYQSVDPQGFMDIKAVRVQYPDWILMGNVACNLLQDVDEPQTRQSVKYCMEHGGVGKRYIFSTSNCIFQGMPPESYDIMLDEYKRLCLMKEVVYANKIKKEVGSSAPLSDDR